MESKTLKISTLEEMEHEAQEFVKKLQFIAKERKHASDSGNTRATLVTLSGNLGAGKTTFTQFVAKALGIEATVNSPTFVLEKIYEIPQSSMEGVAHVGAVFSRLVHIDAYRLENVEDLAVLGFDEIMNHPETLVLLEWPEKVPGIAERATVRISIELLPDNSRQITYA